MPQSAFRIAALVLCAASTLPQASHAASPASQLLVVDANDSAHARAHLSDNAKRVVQTLAALGRPIATTDLTRLAGASHQSDEEAITTIQRVLDEYALLMIEIDDEARPVLLTVTQKIADARGHRRSPHQVQ